MKTSDKLILIFFLSALGLLGAVHLALYARYSQGDIVTEKQLNEEQFIRYNGPAPLVLSIEGSLNIRIIPSDTFSVEMEKGAEAAGKGSSLNKGRFDVKGSDPNRSRQLQYQLQGDTLVITGNRNRRGNPHDPWQLYYSFPKVIVHTGPLKSIRVSGGMATLKGEHRPGLLHTDLSVENALLWIGESYEDGNGNLPAESVDALRIHAANSMLVLHRNAVIGSLAAQLDDRSEISDQQARVGRSSIDYSSGSRINITGANLKNLQPPAP
ncbi:MAG TPA: hypothetical protein VK563_21470 [Puia sp.]|nr:hypothetical protein [Puia sp.]